MGIINVGCTVNQAKYILCTWPDAYHVQQSDIVFGGTLKAGYDLAYHYAGKPFRISALNDENYRTEGDAQKDKIMKEHAYRYDANGNLIYINTILHFRKLRLHTVLHNLAPAELLWYDFRSSVFMLVQIFLNHPKIFYICLSFG
jgi:hypothetical protein